MMNILILGGTGSIGNALIDLLKKNSWSIYVTSRAEKENTGNIHFIKGNAHEIEFLTKCLQMNRWDAVIDFMAYSTPEFSNRVKLILENTEQYFFLSSSRVYAKSDSPITEDSPRLLDVCNDCAYLKTDEYALAKARQENILFESGKTNWTIIRPYKTYNSNRLQLGMFEKEDWLYRIMMGKTLVFPNEMKNKKTTLTYAADVAVAIVALIGNQSAYGQAFHITTTESVAWKDVFNKYAVILQKSMNKRINVKYVDNIEAFYDVWNMYQIKYDCNIDRYFDNSKINKVTQNAIHYTSFSEGVEKCMGDFIISPEWRGVNWKLNRWMDSMTGEKTRLLDVIGMKEKARYIKYLVQN